MDPEISIFVYFITLIIIFFISFYIARLKVFSSLVLAIIISSLAISVLCPKSLFDKSEENKNYDIAYITIYSITVIIVFLYIIIKVSEDVRRCEV